jgi:hypothetical protein
MHLNRLLLATICSIAFGCGATLRESERPLAPPQGFVAGHDGEFKASLYLTSKPDEFVAAWQRPGDPARINVTDHTARGREIECFIIVAGCGGNSAGVCDVVADFEVLDASGHAVSEYPNVSLWRVPPKAVPGRLLPSEASVAITPGAAAPLGTWQVRAIVRDRISDRSVSLRTGLLVADE